MDARQTSRSILSLVIREGEVVAEILSQIRDDSEVDILVLGAAT